jgi:hypothetical protein
VRYVSHVTQVNTNRPSSEKQYSKAFKKWKVKKTIDKKHKERMIGIHRVRNRQKKETVFRYRGNPMAFAKLDRYIRDHKLNEDVLISLEIFSGRKREVFARLYTANKKLGQQLHMR